MLLLLLLLVYSIYYGLCLYSFYNLLHYFAFVFVIFILLFSRCHHTLNEL